MCVCVCVRADRETETATEKATETATERQRERERKALQYGSIWGRCRQARQMMYSFYCGMLDVLVADNRYICLYTCREQIRINSSVGSVTSMLLSHKQLLHLIGRGQFVGGVPSRVPSLSHPCPILVPSLSHPCPIRLIRPIRITRSPLGLPVHPKVHPWSGDLARGRGVPDQKHRL